MYVVLDVVAFFLLGNLKERDQDRVDQIQTSSNGSMCGEGCRW
jgi:hypothetical protein